ncbi:MAG TPA: thioredoxin domain-containing protein [Steroidobacteraceae bacterium]|nr:thioredoxin domain-containing protein [Steroidobacteraceae bacterium]
MQTDGPIHHDQPRRPNRLAQETSPYLQQHADNPVDWYPWGEEALARARREDKPILLSVGYSACHWCHVMAHESFEDPATADLMNRLFVNIKVDREERPDLDKIYQTAQQLLTQRAGGWPLTMFLTPGDQRPFFGGTYFPGEARFGLPAFKDLLARVADYYRDHAAEIREQGRRLTAAFEQLSPESPAAGLELDAAPLARARAALGQSFDRRFGGFGAAPKFPHPGAIERCLRDATEESRSMAMLTLTRMAEGGIYDQLGGGFARYSVDESWTIPHFEKMLYDNGQLLATYAAAAAATGEKLFARIAGETADWLLRDMRSPQGGFYSSLDADSEGHEGRFYAWTPAEVQGLLSPAEYPVFAHRFGLDQPPNFEGRWHLRVRAPLEPQSAAPGAAQPQSAAPGAAALIESARAKLLAARNLRVWPGRDEKILTAWNALTIKGLAIASRVLHRPDLADAATHAVDFIHRTLWRDGRLLATYKDGRAHLGAYLDDYAFLADALLALLESRWRGSDLEFAQALIDCMLDRFADTRAGGFYFTASDHEPLIHRTKSFGDESLPAGNGVAASVLCRLGFLLGEPRYLEAAAGTLRAGFALLHDYPESHLSLLGALQDYLAPLEIVIIRGSLAPRWSRALGSRHAPGRMVLALPAEAQDLPPALAAKRAAGDAIAYLCRGTTCSAPIASLEELTAAL